MLVVCAGEKHNHRSAEVGLVKIIQHIVGAQERITFAHSVRKTMAFSGVFS